MKHTHIVGAALAAFGLTMAGPAMAQPWRYVDKNGAVHYTSNPYELPAKRQAKALKQRKALEERRAKAAAAEKAAAEKARTQQTLNADGVPPPVDQPVIIDNDTTKAATPDPVEAWRKQVSDAERDVAMARAAATIADSAASQAQWKAQITPSGPNYAASQKALKLKADKKKALTEAEATLQRLQRQKPR